MGIADHQILHLEIQSYFWFQPTLRVHCPYLFVGYDISIAPQVTFSSLLMVILCFWIPPSSCGSTAAKGIPYGDENEGILEIAPG